jgi:APA family basic amino acid/polyamine antiporter
LTDIKQEFLGELRIGRQVSGRFQILALGLSVALGLVFLLGAAGVDLLGHLVIVGPLLGILAVGLSLVNAFELLAGSAERSGSYGLAQETLGGAWGFIGGWSLLAGQILLTAGFLQVAAAQVHRLVPGMPLASVFIALALALFFILIELFQALPRRPAQATLMAIFLLGLGVVAVSVLFRLDFAAGLKGAGLGGDGLGHNLAHYALLYAVVESLLYSRRQIRSTGRRLMLNLVISMVLAALGLALFGFLQAGLATSSGSGLVAALAAGGGARAVGIALIAFCACLAAANSTLMTAARQLSSLSRWGGLPDGLRRLRSPFALPPRLFLLLLVALIPTILWVPSGHVVDLAAFMFLVGMLVTVAAAFHSRRTEPDRRRDILLPLFPLLPLTAMAVDLALLLGLPTLRQLGGLLWLGLGLIVYFVFARAHQVTALEGVTTFGREPGIEKPEGIYRILVPLAQGETRHFALSLAAGLARQLKGDVIPLQVIAMPDPLAMEQGRRVAQERNTLFQWSTRLASEAGITISPVTRLSRSVAEGIVDTAIEESCDLILMPWRVSGDLRRDELGRVIDPVVSQAPCDVAVVAYRPDQRQAAGENHAAGGMEGPGERKPLSLKRILVPTSGGPHAPLAVGLALLLSREYGSEVDSVYVAEPGASPEELRAGEGRIRQTLATVQERAAQFLNLGPDIRALDQSRVKPVVVQAEDVVTGITQASQDVDLVFIGSSEQGVIDQVLFGNHGASLPGPVTLLAAAGLGDIVSDVPHAGRPGPDRGLQAHPARRPAGHRFLRHDGAGGHDRHLRSAPKQRGGDHRRHVGGTAVHAHLGL